MELSEGMVAVVRGTQEALCVTLLDGPRQYTLMPNAVHKKMTTNVQSTQKTGMVQHGIACRDSAAQAVDEQYATMYKTAHCHVSPTSPPLNLSEFPPQRAELYPGHGNFQVGGLGSDKNTGPAQVCSSFRGGVCWPDRGSVCSPRPSHESNAFANSLRKYPCVSPERSAEVVERLINYTQQKNARNIKNSSPTRSDCSTYCGRDTSRCCNRTSYEQEAVPEEPPIRGRICKGSNFKDRRVEESPITDRITANSPFRDRTVVESSIRDTIRQESLFRDKRVGESPIRYRSSEVSPFRDKRIDESPNRDRSVEEWECRRFYGRSYDVRYARDVTRRTRESIKNFSTYSTRSVNMETQADVPMVSREIATVPRVTPSIRNVAVPLSTLSSNYDAKRENTLKSKCSSKAIQTTITQDLKCIIRKSAQTCFSSVDILQSKKVKNKRKSRSQEELRISDDFEEETSQLLQELITSPNLQRESEIRNKLLRKLRRAHKLDKRDKVNIKIGRCITDQLYSEIDLRNFTRELSKELIARIKRHNMFIGNNNCVYRADLKTFKKNHEEKYVDEIIKEWLRDLPFNNTDYLDRVVENSHLLHTIANKIKTLVINKLKYSSDSTLKADIIEILEDIPIDVNGHNKQYYINRLVSDLIRKIRDMFTVGYRRRRRKEYPCTYIQPTENELKLFSREEIIEFTKKFRIKVCPETLKQIELELTNIIMDSTEIIKLGNLEDVKEDILMMLADNVSLTEHQAIYFANNIIYNLKDTFEQLYSIRNQRSQTFIVLQNSLDNTHQGGNTNNTDFSIKGITESDIKSNLETYTNQIANQIDEWLANKKGFDKVDPVLKKEVIHALAGDIVDRHKYLELNSSNKNTEDDELEHLKYQIFKWINKIAGEDNLDTIDDASELMKRIKSIPVLMLTNPQHNIIGSLRPCCQNTNFTDSSKSMAVQSTSKGRRFSSVDQYKSQIHPEYFGTLMMNGKEYMNQNSNRTSSGATIPKSSCYKNAAPKDRQNETTQSGFNASMGVTSTPKKSTPLADPATMQTRMRQPQGPSVSMIEPRDKARSPVRRMSSPPGFPPRPKEGNARQEIDNQALPGSTSKVNQACCCKTTEGNTALTEKHETQSVKQLNDDYDEFVKNWVQQIPIDVNGADGAQADKAKLGIYNGVWKAITKLKMDPATLGNTFYYEDMFDEELEDLFNCLPQTEELKAKKQSLKSQLIEKTTQTNELILSAAELSSYKQQLVETVNNNLPKAQIDTGDDVAKLYEEMTKTNIAENFILYINYKEFDRVKSNVFKKKLMKEVQKLIHGIKATHGKELQDIDAAAYVKEIIAALQKVPLPSEDTIREESDEIYIGLEIDQWFSDLPLVPISTNVESLARKRYKDALAKKIHEIETKSKFADCENQIKEEVRLFLEEMPLTPGETDNIEFMVEELVNRLKNRVNDFVAVGGKKKRVVAYRDAYDYEEFSRDMPVCSSFSDLACGQANRSSYMIVDGTRVNDTDFSQYAQLRDATPESQRPWYTLEEFGAPPKFPQEPKRDRLSPCWKTHSGQTSMPPIQTSGKPSTCSPSSQTPAQVIINEPTDNPGQSKLSRSRIRFEQGPRIPREDYDPDEAIGSTRHTKNPRTFEQSRYRSEPGPQASCCRQDPQTSRQYYEDGTADASNEFDKPNTCEGYKSSAPPSYRTEDYTRPASVQTLDFERRRPKTTIPSAQFCGEPIGYSTPQNTSQERERPVSRRKKRTREVERPRREAARKRLDLDDTENESEEDYRCRCMDRVWRCRRRIPMYPPCKNKDYLPCFISPHPFFY